MCPKSKEGLPPQYMTCLACGSVGAASAGAVPAIVVTRDVQDYTKVGGHTSNCNLGAWDVSHQSRGAGSLEEELIR